jgi:hypothetical protein
MLHSGHYKELAVAQQSMHTGNQQQQQQQQQVRLQSHGHELGSSSSSSARRARCTSVTWCKQLLHNNSSSWAA